MKSSLQCLILVAILIDSLTCFGPGIWGAIYETVKEKERADLYNKAALEFMQNDPLGRWKQCNFAIISTAESICGIKHIVRVAVLVLDRWKKLHDIPVYMYYDGTDAGDGNEKIPSLTKVENKTIVEYYSKTTLDRVEKETGRKFEKPSFLVLDAIVLNEKRTKYMKYYGVVIYAFDRKENKRKPFYGCFVREDGVVFREDSIGPWEKCDYSI